MRLYLAEKNPKSTVEDIGPYFSELKRSLTSRCSNIEGKLENALLAGLVDAAQSENYSADLNHILDALDQLELLDDCSPIV